MRRMFVSGLHVLEAMLLNLVILLGKADVAVDVQRRLAVKM